MNIEELQAKKAELEVKIKRDCDLYEVASTAKTDPDDAHLENHEYSVELARIRKRMNIVQGKIDIITATIQAISRIATENDPLIEGLCHRTCISLGNSIDTIAGVERAIEEAGQLYALFLKERASAREAFLEAGASPMQLAEYDTEVMNVGDIDMHLGRSMYLAGLPIPDAEELEPAKPVGKSSIVEILDHKRMRWNEIVGQLTHSKTGPHLDFSNILID